MYSLVYKIYDTLDHVKEYWQQIRNDISTNFASESRQKLKSRPGQFILDNDLNAWKIHVS